MQLSPESEAELAHKLSKIVHDLEGCRIPHDIGLTLLKIVRDYDHETEENDDLELGNECEECGCLMSIEEDDRFGLCKDCCADCWLDED